MITNANYSVLCKTVQRYLDKRIEIDYLSELDEDDLKDIYDKDQFALDMLRKLADFEYDLTDIKGLNKSAIDMKVIELQWWDLYEDNWEEYYKNK